jgi:fatty-acyl-CoA synthase
MLAGLKSDFVYARGLLRVVRRTRIVNASPTKTLGDYLEEWARARGDRPALLSDREQLSYRQLDARANRFARWAFARGLQKGDVVALMMSNRPEYLAIWFGLARAGLGVALINTNLVGGALAHSLVVIGAKAAIVEGALMPAFAGATPLLPHPPPAFVHGPAKGVEPRIDRDIETFSEAPLRREERPALSVNDPALFVYTSGTTGMPKAARITHSRVLRAMFAFSAALDARPSDRIYICLPMYHTNGGFLGPGIALATGGSCYIREKFSVSGFWRDIVDHKCTLFVYIGELCRYLVNAPPGPLDRAHQIRACVGNGLRPDIFAAFQQRFGIPDIVELYASTEGNAAMVNLDSRPGSVGRVPSWAASRFPMAIIAYDVERNAHRRDSAGWSVRCGTNEVGELIAEIRDDPKLPAARFDGYADPAATKAKILRDVFKKGDAWFRTGDLLRRDAQGYYYFVDRIGDTFRWKGENVSTTEVAETIALFPGVKEAIVYGVEVPRHEGRAGMAALVVDEIAEFDLAGLRDHLAKNLPAYARPVFLRFRPNLDSTSTFKPKKMDLVAQGFDPANVDDPVYRDDRELGGYGKVDEAFVRAIAAGTIQL